MQTLGENANQSLLPTSKAHTMNIDDPAAQWNLYAIDRASAVAQTFRDVILCRYGDKWLTYEELCAVRDSAAAPGAVSDAAQDAGVKGFAITEVDWMGDRFNVEAWIQEEYTDGEHRWNEYALRRSQYFRKRRIIGQSFSDWLLAELKAGSLRIVHFLCYSVSEDESGWGASFLIAERRILD